MSSRVLLSVLVVLLGTLGTSVHAGASELRLEVVRVEPSAIVVDVKASQLRAVGSFDVVVHFDPAAIAAPVREDGQLAAGGMLLDHESDPGTYRLAVIVPRGVTGDGVLARLRFPVRAPQDAVDLGLDARLTDLSGVPIDVRVQSARVEVPRVAVGEESPAESTADAEKSDTLEPPDAEPDAESEKAAEAGVAEKKPEAASEAESEDGAARFDREGRPKDPARRAEDLAARAAGHRLQVRFEPSESFSDGASTPMRVTLRAWRFSEALPLSPGSVRLTGTALTVERVVAKDDGLEAQLRIDGESLPAWLEIESFGLLERYRVPVHPHGDVDFDRSGSVDSRDYDRLVALFGARRGQDRYEERFDLVRDKVIDEADLDAFRFNMIEGERARRLEHLAREQSDGAEAKTNSVGDHAEGR